MRTRLTLAVALVTLVAFGGSTAVAARTNDSTETVRWISQETELVVVLANGTRLGPEASEELPQPGDQLFVTEDIFATQDGRTKGNKIGTNAIACVFGAARNIHCDGTAFLESGQLQFGATFPLPEERLDIDVTFVGGTGKFRAAGGDAHLSDIPPQNGEVSMTLWEVRLLDLQSGEGGLLDGLLGGLLGGR